MYEFRISTHELAIEIEGININMIKKLVPGCVHLYT